MIAFLFPALTALLCPALPQLTNGLYLTTETEFHFQATVSVHCHDGYFYQDSTAQTSNTDGEISCTGSGEWSAIPNCFGMCFNFISCCFVIALQRHPSFRLFRWICF